MFYYVYRITNIEKNKYYIGSRASEIKPEKDLGHLYFSSSTNKQFIEEQKKNPSKFLYEIIKTFPDIKQAAEYEEDLIHQTNAINDINCYNRRSRLSFTSVNSKVTENTVLYLANLIKIARKEHGISQNELAVRLNVSKNIVHRIEEGNLNIAIGTVFEACFILGIPLLGVDQKYIHNLSSMLSYMNRLIPEKSKNKIVVNDDF